MKLHVFGRGLFRAYLGKTVAEPQTRISNYRKQIHAFFMDFIENIQNIHIGRVIEEKLKEKSMTVTELADNINCVRTNVHDIFKRKSIDTELLIAISKALDYDFIRNIYYKEQTSSTIFISIKTKEDLLNKFNLLEEFIRLVKPQE